MGCANVARGTWPSGPAALVGRDGEVRRITEGLEAMAAGRPGLLILEGLPGSGRTRLLEEIGSIARRRGVTVRLEAEWVGGAGIARGPGEDGPGPVLFLCDHPQRIDLRVWAWMELLAESVPVLVAITAHAGTDPFPAGHLASAWVRRISLPPLRPREVERLATLLLGGRPGADLLALLRVAAGRPEAVRDLLTGLREESQLAAAAGRVSLRSVRLPERTRIRVAGQVAALSPQARHLVRAATTLRSPFPLVRLTRLLRINPVPLLPAIDEVLESGLLTGDDELLRFSHETVRSVVESSMPRAVVAALRDERARLDPRTPDRRAPSGTAVPSQRSGRVAEPGSTPASPERPVLDWSVLSEREREIAVLAGRALTNRQIATRVGRSPHTVNYHLRQIFQKLGITSRVELASLMRRREAAEHPATDPSSS